MTGLAFLAAKLILQAPRSVFEGDSVTLMCRTKRNVTLTRTLYKNNKALMGLDKNFSFHIKHSSLKDNGEYRCTGFEAPCCSVSSNTIKIQVQGKAFISSEKGSWEGRSVRWSRVRRVGWAITEPQGSFLPESENVQECFELKSVGVVSPPLPAPLTAVAEELCFSPEQLRPQACCDSSL